MMQQMDEQNGMWLQGGVNIRSRDGEDGTSKLTEAKTPLTWSSSPFGQSRFEFTATPITLSAGSASGDAWRRYGTNPLSNAASNLATTINSEINSLAGMTADQKAQYLALHPTAALLDGHSEVSAGDYSFFTTAGLSLIHI